MDKYSKMFENNLNNLIDFLSKTNSINKDSSYLFNEWIIQNNICIKNQNDIFFFLDFISKTKNIDKLFLAKIIKEN